MQNVGLQTVLQMSNAAEKIQSVAQSQTALASEQYKEIQDKINLANKEEVWQTQQAENAKIREEDQRKRKQGGQEAPAGETKEGKPQEDPTPESEMTRDAAEQGQLLNIKV